MKKKGVKIFVIIMFVLVISTTSYLFADVGNVNRYDSNSSSSSSSVSADGLIGFLLGLFINNPVLALVIIGIGLAVFMYLKKNGKLGDVAKNISEMQTKYNEFKDGTFAENMANKVAGEGVSKQIAMIDPAFSEEAFLGWTREVFMKIQQAWSTRDWKVIRPFESNELFSQHSAQLQEYINNNKINVIEKVSIKSCSLSSFKQDGDKEVVTVYLQAVMRDYVIDATTRNVLESDPNTDWNMKYIMTFIRKAGVKTSVGTSNKSTTNCPNCGAPTQITSAGQCEYCDSVITTGDHDWVLSDIKGVN